MGSAHELPMVYAALAADDEAMRQAPYEVLRDWARMYGGNLLIVLPDCFGSTDFLARAPDWVADWKRRPPGFEGAAGGGARVYRLVAQARGRSAREAACPFRRDGYRHDRNRRQGAARPPRRLDRLGIQPHQPLQGLRDRRIDGELKAIRSSGRSPTSMGGRRSSSPTIPTRCSDRPKRSRATAACSAPKAWCRSRWRLDRGAALRN